MGDSELPPPLPGLRQRSFSDSRTALRELIGEPDERAARRALRTQIARLEGKLSDAFVTAFPMGGLDQPEPIAGEPRVLDLGELEIVRDQLAERLHAAQRRIAERADEQEAKRVQLERMLLDPGAYRYTRIPCRELGEPGCGVWQVRPRLGVIGMLMGWWQVKLSSGCPLAMGRGFVAARFALPSRAYPDPAGGPYRTMVAGLF